MIPKFLVSASASSRRVLQRISTVRLSSAPQRFNHFSTPLAVHRHAASQVHQLKVISACTSLQNQRRNYCTARQSEVSYEDLQALMRSKDVKLVDVREPQELTQYGKIEGSVNIPLSKLKEALQMSDESFTECYKCDKPLLHDTNIVFYGLGPIKSTAALELAFKLGFKKARHYKGGWVEYAQKSGQPEKKSGS